MIPVSNQVIPCFGPGLSKNQNHQMNQMWSSLGTEYGQLSYLNKPCMIISTVPYLHNLLGSEVLFDAITTPHIFCILDVGCMEMQALFK